MNMPKSILAPDPNPVKPGYTPPADACDGHCHVFGPAARFSYAPNRSYTPEDAGRERLAALHKHLGLSRAIIVQASCHGTYNSAMLDALAHSKGAWCGVAMVKPDESEKELVRLHAGGVRGARINFVAHLGGAPDMAAVSAVIKRITPLGWHLQLHLDAHDIRQYRSFLDGLKIPFIIDHMGRPEAKLGVKQDAFLQMLDLMKNPLAWTKVSGPERISSTGQMSSAIRPVCTAPLAKDSEPSTVSSAARLVFTPAMANDCSASRRSAMARARVGACAMTLASIGS